MTNREPEDRDRDGNKGSFLVGFLLERGREEGRLQLITDQTQSCRSSFVISIIVEYHGIAEWNAVVAAVAERFSGKKLFWRINKCLGLEATHNN